MYGKAYPLTLSQKLFLGRRIRYLRQLRNFTVEELASSLGMSPESIYRMENGDFELFDDFQ